MKKSIKFLIVMIIMYLLVAPMTVNAANETFKLTLKADKEKVESGNEVVVTVEIADIDVGEDGVGALKFELDYDNTKFDKVTKEDITYKGKWSDVSYNDESKVLLLMQEGTDYTKSNEEVCTIKLKAKNIAKDEKVSFGIKNIEGSDSNVTIETENVKLEFNQGKDSKVFNDVMVYGIGSVCAVIIIVIIVVFTKKKKTKN